MTFSVFELGLKEMPLNEFNFRGLMAPVFTPFDAEGKVNRKLIPSYAEYLHNKGIRGVLVNGTTGEGTSMTTKERLDVFHDWMIASRNLGQTVVVQVGGTNSSDVKALARDAESWKASAILCLADLFFRPSNVDDLIAYLKMVSAEAPSTPLLYYHVPGFTRINVDMRELMKRRHEVPTLAGMKFTDVDLVTGNKCLKPLALGTKNPAIFLGCDQLLLSALIQGFDSAIGTTINLFPVTNNNIFRYFNEGNIEKASEEQKKLNVYIDSILEKGSWVSSMKAAMRKVSPIDVGPVRDPLTNVHMDEIVSNLSE